MLFRKFWCIILSLSVQFILICNAKEYAEISSSYGNIIIRSATDKNISLETQGQCDVYINGADFANAVPTIRRVEVMMKDYRASLKVNVIRLEELQITYKQPLIRKIEATEKLMEEVKNSRFNPNLSQTLKVKISTIRTQVAEMRSLLSENDCASSPCQNGGTCQDLFSGFHCNCANGWEGIHCEKDIDECVLFNSTDLGCQNGGICRNKPGSYECICVNGWHGLHCITKSTGCFSGPASEICGHGICIPQDNEFGRKCICEQGWTNTKENEACILDVDECKDENPACSKDPPVSCENIPGSFRCGSCPAGYTGNGQYCTDINECELNNGGCSLNPMVECINRPGSKYCNICPPGYIGDGVICEYQGLCRTNNGNCHPLATCVEFPNIVQYAECRCPPGYHGNGYGPRGCLPSTINACTSSPCKFGRCIPDSNQIEGFKCICQRDYFGKYCNHMIGMCFSNPCKNGGLCVNVNTTSYSCICRRGYSGEQCELSPHECGDLLHQESGVIAYPTNPTSYLSCTWTILTEKNRVFNISFSQFSVGQENDCNSEWLQITDGIGSNTSTTRKYCGNQLPGNGQILSTTNVIDIRYRAKEKSSYFKLKWKSVQPQCHEIFNLTANPVGIIRTPNWPNNYPQNLDCVWLLQAPAGRSIKLTFVSFDIGNDTDCSGDFLEVSSSFAVGKDILDKKCGGPIPQPMTSEIPEMRIHFHSDKQNTHRGFQIDYSLQPACGILLKDASGIIVPPNVTKELVCFYQISHDLELKTKLTFNSLSLSKSDSCEDEYVALYEGFNTSSPLIGRYCGDTPPSLYISDSGVISVKYKKTRATSYFSLKYEAVCEGIFEDPVGIIHSIGYPKSLPVGLTCIYLIKQQPLSMITLQYSTDFEDYSYYDECETSFLEIRDGDNENATLIDTSGDYDDSYKDTSIYSSYNSLWIKISSSSLECTSNFMANYSTTSDCGSFLRNTTGSIIFNNAIRNKRNCRWVLQAPNGFFIQLYVTLFDFSESHRCSLSHVDVYENNSYSKNAKLIGSYCGKRIPPLILIPSNLATITVSTARVDKQQEFSANYIFLNETKVCGGNFFSKSGTIKSPQYPKSYPPASDCVWTITVDGQNQIELKTSIFRTMVPCTLEYLEIRNGGSSFSPLIGRFCGVEIPKVIRSHTNQLYLHLVSTFQVSMEHSKFMFTWEATTTGCGGKLTSASGALASPNYPEPYHSIADCQWSIIVSQGSTIQLVFLDLDLESKKFFKNCSLDYIEIFDGSSKAAKSLGRFCGSQYPQSLMSASRRMDIYFKSDISTEGRGFNLHYRTICNNNFTGYGGVIESPNFPETYPLLQECTWFIKVTKKNTINITFSHFDLSERGYHVYPFFTLQKGAHLNWLQVYTIKTSETLLVEEKVLFDTYVGSTFPESITVPTDHVMINFKTDTNLMGNGFRLEWVVNGCGGHLNKPGTITSPNYPKKYTDDIECAWLLEAPVGKSIVLRFTAVDVEKHNLCPYDVIKVFNGPDSSYPLLGSLCHMEEPVTFTSNGHLMHVSFVSDSSYAGKGFSAAFEYTKSKCGGELSASSGSISSPNYPKNFDIGDYCEWLISVDENHVIDLSFETVDLISSKNCSNNFIKVYDGSSTKSAALATVCDITTRTFTSSSNQMLVVFKSKKPASKSSWRGMDESDSLTSQGFLAVYSKACGARIVASDVTGNLRLKPHSMSHSLFDNKCEWTIVAPKTDQRVSLTVTRLHMQSVRDPLNGLSVYGGESTKSPLIGEYSTDKLPPTIVSGGPALHVEVKGGVDFFAIYHIFGANCGGTLTGLNGMFSPVGTSCEWTIQVAAGNEISLSFKNFNLPFSKNCAVDYLEIRERNATGSLRGIFCGEVKPRELTHQGSLWLFYKTERENNTFNSKPVGFLAEYATSTNVEVTGIRGEIASPLYPESFASSDPFTWKITVLGSARIQLEFVDFQTENFEDGVCFSPYLKVYDGGNNEAAELGTFCGLKKPDILESSSNVLLIEADMDSSRLDNRFMIKWRRIFHQKLPRLNKTCGSEDIIDLRQLHKFNLTSPGFPHGYAQNLNCEWSFQTESANSLRVKVNSMDLGFSSFCFHDYIKLTSDNLNKKVCHILQGRTYNATRTLKVSFITNAYFNGSGFAVEISEGCGGVMKESSGVITFDKNSPRDWTCKWKINVKPGRRISIEFMKFTTNSSKRCDNSITLKNGFDATSPNLGDGKFCEIPPKLKTTGNNLYMEFNGNPNNTEFKAVYREVLYDCGGSFALSEKLSSMQIMSPNHPGQSEPFIECFWVITSPPGSYLQVDFIGKFDFHQRSDCHEEAVELRDGGTNLSPLIDKFCKKSPNSQYSTDNIIFVKYFTKAKEPGDGFLANVSIASCGGTYKSRDGVINWSWIPGNPHIHRNCTWNIIVPFHESVNVEVTFKGLEMTSYTCATNGRFAVYEIVGESIGSTKKKLLTDMCDSSKYKNISSASNRVAIEFTNIMGRFKYQHPVSVNIRYHSTGRGCSYILNTDFGEIQSPNYPNLDYFKGYCVWAITVPKGRRITVNLTDFDLEKNSATSREGQSILFMEYGEYLMEQLFYNSTKRLYKSSGNALNVIFWCEQSTTHRGFKAFYTSDEETVCNQDFSAPSGRFFRLPEDPKYICIYKNTQKLPINRTLALTINSTLNYNASEQLASYKKSSISVESNCTVASSFLPLVALGGFNFGATLFSNSRPLNEAVIVRLAYPATSFKIRMKSGGGNFSVYYEYYPCGGYLQNTSGSISTPGKNQERLECAWVIDLPTSDRIKLNFLSMNLGEDCEKSYVDVYNGKHSTSPKMGRFCNTNNPGLIVSQRNNLLIEYHHDKSSPGVGFNATYDTFTEGCGGTITDSYQLIETPNYPNDYPNNAECRWIIAAPEGSHMLLSSVGRFYLEETDGCKNDYVEIFDWKNDQWVSLRKWCGRGPPNKVNSNGNKVLVLFRSNDRISGSGFQIKWQMKCGGSFRATTEKKYITSPGYPQKYDNNLACTYFIYGRDKLVAEFEDFSLEGDYPTCTNDNVTVSTYSGMKSYCGQTKPPKIEGQNTLIIKFRTDVWIGNSGFKLSFKTDECGETITEPTVINKTFTNIRTYRRSYYRDFCLWNITAPKNKTIMMKFTYYSEIYSYMSCIGNALEIFDGPKLTNLLAKICGARTSQIPIITTTSNMGLLSWRTVAGGQIAFTVEISFTPGPEEGCGGVYKLNGTKIIRPPEDFTNADCQWKFEVEEGYKIEFKIESLKLPDGCGESREHGSRNCTCSFLEIRDGAGPFSEEIDQFCSNTNYSQIYTTTWKFGFLRFYTATNYTADTFTMSVRPIKDICSPREYTAERAIHTITSPGYPNPYGANINCRWTIKKLNFRQHIVVRFTEIDLTNSTKHGDENMCSGDRIELGDGAMRRTFYEGKATSISTISSYNSYQYNKGEIMQFCGKGLKQFSITSKDSVVSVGFVSKSDPHKGKGFKMEYFLSGCSNNFTQDSGSVIASHGNLSDCMIYITSSENTTLSLYIGTFWQGYRNNCSSEALEIYDGHSKQSTRLLRYCGHSNPNPVFGNTNKMLIVLSNTHTYASSLLEATFMASSNGRGCGGRIFDQSGTITSPFYPNNYTSEAICTWEINVPVGAQIKADFMNFRINGQCENNYLKVATYENGKVNERKFCPTDRIATLYSTNKMLLTYKSSTQNTGTGWLMKFRRSASRNGLIRNIYSPYIRPMPRFGHSNIRPPPFFSRSG